MQQAARQKNLTSHKIITYVDEHGDTVNLHKGIILLALGMSVHAGAQDPESETTVPVYYKQANLTEPEAFPMHVNLRQEDQCQKLEGKVVLSIIVDEQGRPRDIIFLEPLGNGLDVLALKLASLNKFKPGTLEGKPVPVAVRDEIRIHGCVARFKDDKGDMQEKLVLAAQPEQKFSLRPLPPQDEQQRLAPFSTESPTVQKLQRGKDRYPQLLKTSNPGVTEEARKEHIQGICELSVLVDVHGMSHVISVNKHLGAGLDESAMRAVSLYRFKPALRNGHPVPAKITVEVSYQPG